MLHAYLIVVFGDIPAISMIVHMKGHNALLLCCMCNIKGIHIPSSQITIHYIPLNCEHFLDEQQEYHPNFLPLQNHNALLNEQLKFKLPQLLWPQSNLPRSMELISTLHSPM